SFPAAFAIAGAGAALLVRSFTGGRSFWLLAGALAVVAAGSGGSMWYFHARHLYYPGLHEHWGAGGWGGFPDLSRPLSAAVWPLKVGVEAGNYGTREMGAVLLVLAAVGVRRFLRVSPALAAAVVVPAALAVAATYLGKYPLANRTVM